MTRPTTSGTYRLEIGDGIAHCERVSGNSALRFEIDVLGSLYLGGGHAMALSSAGRITGDPEAVRALHRLFRTDVPPWCPEVF